MRTQKDDCQEAESKTVERSEVYEVMAADTEVQMTSNMIDMKPQKEQYQDLDSKTMAKSVTYEDLNVTSSKTVEKPDAYEVMATDTEVQLSQNVTDMNAQKEQYQALDSQAMAKSVAYEDLNVNSSKTVEKSDSYEVMATDTEVKVAPNLTHSKAEKEQYQDLDSKTMTKSVAYEDLNVTSSKTVEKPGVYEVMAADTEVQVAPNFKIHGL